MTHVTSGGSSPGDYSNGRYSYRGSYGSQQEPANPLSNGLLIGGGSAAAVGTAFGGHALWARSRVAERGHRVAAAETALASANQHETATRAALAQDQVHPPAGTSADEALRWARGRFDDSAGYALTREGSRQDLTISRWGTPARSPGDAASGARALSDGNAGAVVRAGEWHVPVRFAQDLDALEKSRQVSYTTSEYTYGFGHNPATGKYESYFGNHPVTKYRTEHYLDEFDRVVGSHDGLGGAFRDDMADLRHVGTPAEFAVDDAVGKVGAAKHELTDATRSLGYATSGRSAIVRNVGLGVALLGAGAIGAGLLTRER